MIRLQPLKLRPQIGMNKSMGNWFRQGDFQNLSHFLFAQNIIEWRYIYFFKQIFVSHWFFPFYVPPLLQLPPFFLQQPFFLSPRSSMSANLSLRSAGASEAKALKASKIGRYPVQRQMLPSMIFSTSDTVAFGLLSNKLNRKKQTFFYILIWNRGFILLSFGY